MTVPWFPSISLMSVGAGTILLIFFYLKPFSVQEFPLKIFGISNGIVMAIGIGIEKVLFLPCKFFYDKKRVFTSKCLIYSFLFLVIWHKCPFTTVIHFSTVSYPTWTKLPKETSLVESFYTLNGLPGSFSCCLEQFFCRESVGTCFCRKEVHRRH